MVIGIKAKNIYGKDNEKVRDNQTNSVEYEENVVSDETISLFNTSISPFDSNGNFAVDYIEKSTTLVTYSFGIYEIEVNTDIGFEEVFGFCADYIDNKNEYNKDVGFKLLPRKLVSGNDPLFDPTIYLQVYINENASNKYTLTIYYFIAHRPKDGGFTGESFKVTAITLSASAKIYKSESEAKSNSIAGESNKKVFSLDSNEIIQPTTKVGNVAIGKYLSDKVLNDYKNGKETATLKCNIGEYYSTDGEIAISTKGTINEKTKTTFEIGDKVIPYVMSANREVAMSYYRDGTPKQFVVTATEIFFDGAVWQKLTLQEIVHNS